MELKQGERLDYVNDSLSLIQDPEGLTFGTDALLLAGYMENGYNAALELGAGTGIISMLALKREKIKTVRALEIQEEFVDLIQRNAEYNGLEDMLFPTLSDVREFRGNGEYDCVYTNPPYMRADSGRLNLSSKKTIARHELFGGIEDFVSAGARALKWGGSFYAVYRTDRLIDLICVMRKHGIEPKRMTYVHADTGSQPSMVLIEGRRGGASGLKVTRPLIIYKDKEHKEYTPDMQYIMDFGIFGEGFGVKNGKS